MWSHALLRPHGIRLALQAAEHVYVVTAPIPGLPRNLPTLRVPDEWAYYKEDAGKLLVGAFEPVAKPWALDGIPPDVCFDALPDDTEHFAPVLERAIGRVPVLAQTGIATWFNGAESFTPDDRGGRHAGRRGAAAGAALRSARHAHPRLRRPTGRRAAWIGPRRLAGASERTVRGTSKALAGRRGPLRSAGCGAAVVPPRRAPAQRPGIQFVPASGTPAIAAASTVSATRSSRSRWCTFCLPQARASVLTSIAIVFR
jgi:hypothetical protein